MDIYDTLKKYKELLDEGIITQQEFENKKRTLLGIELLEKEQSSFDYNERKQYQDNDMLDDIQLESEEINNKEYVSKEKNNEMNVTASLGEQPSRLYTKINDSVLCGKRKKFIIGLLGAVLFFLLFIAMVYILTEDNTQSNEDYGTTSNSYSETYDNGNDGDGKISDSEIEDIAIQTLYKSLLSLENRYDIIDADACKYSIGSFERDNGQVEVYGIVCFYDKHGGVTDVGGDYSKDFTVHMTEWGSAAWCDF